MKSELTKARWDRGYESRFMAEADGWVMCRRPGAMPYLMTKREWLALPLADEGRKLHEQYRRAIVDGGEG